MKLPVSEFKEKTGEDHSGQTSLPSMPWMLMHAKSNEMCKKKYLRRQLQVADDASGVQLASVPPSKNNV